MILSLARKGLRRGKARFLCAAAGVAAAAGAVVFTFSLAATNAAQAPALARRAAAPWAAWRLETSRAEGAGRKSHAEGAEGVRGAPDLSLALVSLTIDLRPDGHVLQGPPMRAVLAAAPAENPWGCTRLAEGRWTDDASAEAEVVCTRDTLQRFGRGEPPPLGSPVKFVGAAGTMTATVVGYLDAARLPPGWPGAFANRAAFAALAGEPHGTLSLWSHGRMAEWSNGRMVGSSDHQTTRPPDHQTIPDLLTPDSETVTRAFAGDENRRMDYARPLLLVAAVLTALCLLVNSLLLSVEANRRTLATLRTVGLTRGGTVALVAAESLLAVAAGFAAGCAVALLALRAYVAADSAAFPTGPSADWRAVRTAAGRLRL